MSVKMKWLRSFKVWIESRYLALDMYKLRYDFQVFVDFDDSKVTKDKVSPYTLS